MVPGVLTEPTWHRAGVPLRFGELTSHQVGDMAQGTSRHSRTALTEPRESHKGSESVLAGVVAPGHVQY